MESININPEETKESQEHVDEMVAKAEGKETNEETAATQEELLAGKYKNEEDLQKGILELLKKDQGDDLESVYKNLESQVLSQSKEEEEEEKPETNNETKEEDLEEEQEAIKDEVQNFDKYEQEYFENGELSEEAYAELEEQGFSRNIVDRYVEGAQAVAEKQANEVFEITGGQDGYEEMVNWAASNLSQEEKAVFNESLESNRTPQVKFAVEALYNKYTRAEGQQPSQVVDGGKPSTSSQAKGYQSRAELVADMNSPKYEKDSAFRQQVERKLKNSSII